MTNVFAVLKVYPEGDGYACTQLEHVFVTLESATAFAETHGGIYNAPLKNGKWGASYRKHCGKYEIRSIPLEDK